MIKRTFDICVAVSVLIVLSPLILFLSFFVVVKLGRPILFKQLRPGRDGVPFIMLKFRTMLESVDSHGQLLSDEKRLTAFGKYLRSTSLDEVPGLWNVLKGDMSLVGPRPLLMEYLPLYNERQKKRHDVRPGITGWAQVNGRNAISWEEKFELDVWYVENQSFWLDITILFLTVKKVLGREGVSADGHVTTEPFKGSKDD
ncbi:sugar transferase [Reinekea forsetii]|nr:sugar transferase [Reinekea forsetii]